MYDLDDDYGPANEEDGEIVSYHSLMFGRRFTFRLSRASEKMTGLREYYCVACRDIDEKCKWFVFSKLFFFSSTIRSRASVFITHCQKVFS